MHKTRKTNLYLNNSYMCWLDNYVVPYNNKVFISYLKCNCYSMFKINKHRFSNHILSIILSEFRYKF
jgi:hypothetical protein